jgi:hypothetical protein
MRTPLQQQVLKLQSLKAKVFSSHCNAVAGYQTAWARGCPAAVATQAQNATELKMIARQKDTGFGWKIRRF